MRKVCLNCSREFPHKNNKKFCSAKCKCRFNSKRDYHNKWKYDKEYMQRNKVRFTEWRTKHRIKFNNLCREPNRIRSKVRYDKLAALGLCRLCGKEKVTTFVTCDSCRNRENYLKRKLYARKK